MCLWFTPFSESPEHVWKLAIRLEPMEGPTRANSAALSPRLRVKLRHVGTLCVFRLSPDAQMFLDELELEIRVFEEPARKTVGGHATKEGKAGPKQQQRARRVGAGRSSSPLHLSSHQEQVGSPRRAVQSRQSDRFGPVKLSRSRFAEEKPSVALWHHQMLSYQCHCHLGQHPMC